MSIKCDVKPIEIGEERYYTVKQFANLTNHSEQSIRVLIYKGNSLRKLRVNNMLGRPLIYTSELTDFPFTTPGRSRVVYFYDNEGNIDRTEDIDDVKENMMHKEGDMNEW